MSGVVFVRRGLLGYIVESPFSAKDIIKETVWSSGREWDKTQRAWIISPIWIEDLIRALRRHGYTVKTDFEETRKTPPPPPPSAHWTDDVLRITPSKYRKCVYRALSKELHPDRGGDLVEMQKLTAAYEKHAA